jgi:hypothetical protein
MNDTTPDWAEPARQALAATAGELAATGQLAPDGMKGMLTTATIIAEFVGEDGQTWHTIMGFPTETWRDEIVHIHLFERHLGRAEWHPAGE